MLRCTNKLWIENINDLFCNTSIIPLEGMSLESQMNALSRLVIVVFLVLILLRFKSSTLFLLLSLLFIIILYYIQRKQMETFKAEHYSPQETGRFIERPPRREGRPINTSNLYFDNPTHLRFCDDNKPVINTLVNKSGTANPKTFLTPVIAAPIADLDYWKANNLVVHSSINDETQQDAFQSGYQVSTCCGNNRNKKIVPVKKSMYATNGGDSKEGYQKSLPVIQQTMDCTPIYNKVTYPEPEQTQENFIFPHEIRKEQPGQMNTSCGYNPKQLVDYNLPSNLPAGNCQKQTQFSDYNKNLFTQTIQPGIYSRNQLIEPINSNIGISFNQQFEPVTCEENNSEGLTYIENDPRIMDDVLIEPNYGVINSVNNANIYDPRHSGYGTSYRSYTDENLGQTKFYYDDIDSIRMPNYITRSNIDFERYADSYGPLPENGGEGNPYHSDIRALAQDSFTRSTIKQRTELQERMTRKIRANAWQQRVAPIHKNSQYMLGGMSRR